MAVSLHQQHMHVQSGPCSMKPTCRTVAQCLWLASDQDHCWLRRLDQVLSAQHACRLWCQRSPLRHGNMWLQVSKKVQNAHNSPEAAAASSLKPVRVSGLSKSIVAEPDTRRVTPPCMPTVSAAAANGASATVRITQFSPHAQAACAVSRLDLHTTKFTLRFHQPCQPRLQQ